jgi:hypothetical protein
VGKIPKAEDVKEVLARVLREHREVSSLRTLRKLVREGVGEEGTLLSEERVKRLAVELGASIRVEKRRSHREAERCFLCEGEWEPLRTRDLYGRETSGGKRCRRCGLRLERDQVAPSRYVFRMGGGGPVREEGGDEGGRPLEEKMAAAGNCIKRLLDRQERGEDVSEEMRQVALFLKGRGPLPET